MFHFGCLAFRGFLFLASIRRDEPRQPVALTAARKVFVFMQYVNAELTLINFRRKLIRHADSGKTR
jgi:hypothetical protein